MRPSLQQHHRSRRRVEVRKVRLERSLVASCHSTVGAAQPAS